MTTERRARGEDASRRVRRRAAGVEAESVELARAALPLGGERSRSRLLHAIGDARFVLLGAVSHGTHEHYRERALLTERLIAERGFDAVAVEAPFPEARRVHCWIQGRGDDHAPEDALGGFARFPRWMWRNADVRDFVAWVQRSAPYVGFHGLDLYGLHASAEAVVRRLERVDPEAARRARSRYSCFEPFAADASTYAFAAGLGLGPSCERDVRQELLELQERSLALLDRAAAEETSDGLELCLELEMNARLVQGAEAYYRSMLADSVTAWNLRDRHMADTLAAIVHHLDRRLGRACKLVVWGHNTHVGDARATQLSDDGRINVGQLARERYGRDAFLVGFTTFEGTVLAAIDWAEEPLQMTLRPAARGSHEHALHEAAADLGVEDVVVLPGDDGRLPHALRHARLERVIGVVHRDGEPKTHWMRARIGDQFDAIVHVGRTTAVEPLDAPSDVPSRYELPATFPFAV